MALEAKVVAGLCAAAALLLVLEVTNTAQLAELGIIVGRFEGVPWRTSPRPPVTCAPGVNLLVPLKPRQPFYVWCTLASCTNQVYAVTRPLFAKTSAMPIPASTLPIAGAVEDLSTPHTPTIDADGLGSSTLRIPRVRSSSDESDSDGPGILPRARGQGQP